MDNSKQLAFEIRVSDDSKLLYNDKCPVAGGQCLRIFKQDEKLKLLCDPMWINMSQVREN